jgi:hypothetical protein
MQCTWVGCTRRASHDQRTKISGRIWAHLCATHNRQLTTAKVDPDRSVFIRAITAAAGFNEKGQKR